MLSGATPYLRSLQVSISHTGCEILRSRRTLPQDDIAKDFKQALRPGPVTFIKSQK
jgi:hypothetical protein